MSAASVPEALLNVRSMLTIDPMPVTVALAGRLAVAARAVDTPANATIALAINAAAKNESEGSACGRPVVLFMSPAHPFPRGAPPPHIKRRQQFNSQLT